MAIPPYTGKNESFEAFWKLYPRKQSKGDAWKAWHQVKPNEETVALVIESLGWQKRQWEWVKDGGQWIPLPATWLRDWRWLDEKPRELRNAKPEPVRQIRTAEVPEAEPVYDTNPEHDMVAAFEKKVREINGK